MRISFDFLFSFGVYFFKYKNSFIRVERFCEKMVDFIMGVFWEIVILIVFVMNK